MRIQLVTSSVSALCSRARIELTARGHDVSQHLVSPGESDASLVAAVEAARPDVIVAPTLKRILPEAVWRRVPCLIVHPGIRGDRGMSSLDWAIHDGERTWGVTLIQAAAEVDAGDVWAWREFPMRDATKTGLYRHEVSDAALDCILEAIDAVATGGRGRRLASGEGRGRYRPPMKQADRAIDWEHDSTETVLRKLRAADTSPGVLDRIHGQDVLMFGGHAEATLRAGARPGDIFAQRAGAICRATRDGAVWITHLRPRGSRRLKLPASHVLGPHVLRWVPEIPARWRGALTAPTWRDIWYEETGSVGAIHFNVYNGALSSEQCTRLRRVFEWARQRPTRVIVLLGGTEFFCNGIHLSLIEAAPCAARASWDNIVAIDDLVQDVIETTSHVVVASLAGDAAAGGVMLALAADRVHARAGVILNPHYRALELFGSEFWTYLLPRRIGATAARAVTEQGQPVSAAAARALGLVDEVSGTTLADHRAQVLAEARRIAEDADALLAAKRARRECDEAMRPLAAYRDDELRRMRSIFDDPTSPYHRRRRRFLLGETTPPPVRSAPGSRPLAGSPTG